MKLTEFRPADPIERRLWVAYRTLILLSLLLAFGSLLVLAAV